MGDAIGGAASGGKSASAAEAGGGGGGADIASADPSGGLGGIDPSFGMGAAGWDPSGGGGMGSAFGSFPGQIPGDPAGSLRALQPPITDQPSATPPATQQPQAPQQQPQQYGSASEALFKGLMDKEYPGLSLTPGGQQFASLPTADDASKVEAWAPQANTNVQIPKTGGVSFDAIDPSQSTGIYAQPQTGGVKFDAIEPNLKPGVNFEAIDPSQSTGAYSRQNPPSVSITNADRPATTGATRSFESPAAAAAGPDLTASSDSSGTQPAPRTAAPPATPSITPPGGTAAGGATEGGATVGGGTAPGIGTGMGMHSPLEQLVGQFIHMLLGGSGGRGGIGSMLEQMIDRALGINPQRMFPQYYGGGFNPPEPAPGSGYFPAGTTGGRTISPGSRPGAPPSTPPGPPGTPGNQPSAITPIRPGIGVDYTTPWRPGERAHPDPNLPGQESTRPIPPPDRGFGAIQNQGNRPRFYSGNLTIGGQQFKFGSGGGRFPSLPYGTYYLHPGAIGNIGHRIGAIAGISDSNNPNNNTVNDPLYRGEGGTHAREGVEVHPDVSGSLRSNGCIAINRSQWPDFARAFRNAAAQGPLTLTVRPDGSASIQSISDNRANAIRSIRYQSQAAY